MEDVKVVIRNVRADFRNEWKKASDDGLISEDEFFRREKLLQELIDKKSLEVEDLGKFKTEELSQI